MREMLSIYRDRLINLSTKNRTLLLKKLYRKVAFDLSLLEQVNRDEFSIRLLNLLKKRYNGKMKILSGPYDEENYNLYESFKYIYRESNNIQREKGSYDLYVGYPFVEGKFKDGTLIKAPLLLFPIKLKIENEEVFLSDLEDEYITINKAFILGFKKYNEIKLKDFELEFETLDCDNILEWVLDYLAENGIFIDREEGYEEIKQFKELNKCDADLYQSGDLVVKNNFIIGQFPNSTSSIYDDYVELINEDKKNVLINNLIELDRLEDDQKSYNNQKNVNESNGDDLDNYFVTELDYSQESAIKASSKTKELVIYGPPGTGKSQVIVNLIVDNLAKGKKVLMVSQKKAAIDVVYNRLLKVGLENRIANIESPNSDRQKVFSKIKSTLDHIEDYFEYNYDLNFNYASKSIKLEKEKLEKLAIILNEKTEFGLTLNQLYAKSVNEYEYFIEELSENFSIFKDINTDDLEVLIKNIERVSDYLNYDVDNIIVKNRNSFADFQEIEKERILDITLRIKRYTEEYKAEKLKNSYVEHIEKIIIDNKIDSVELLKKLSEIIEYLDKGKIIPKRMNTKDLNKLGSLSDIVKKNKTWTLEYWQSRFELKRRVTGCSLAQIIEYIDETRHINSLVKDLKNYFYTDEVLNIYDKVKLRSSLMNYVKSIEIINKPINEVKLLDKYFNSVILNTLTLAILKNGNWESLVSDISYIVSTCFDGLKTLDHLKDKLTERERLILNYEENKFTTDDSAKISKAIRNTFYLKHIELVEKDHREIINSVDKPSNINYRMEKLLEEKRRLVPNIVVNKLSNDLKDIKEYADIRYESEKKTNKMSLRRFVHSFYDKGLLELLPCWLVTPEVVSSVFPLEEGIFDVVIFDEASQMFIENGIPAIYRSKSIVIAGDDKQLQPNDIYKVRLDDSLDSDERDDYEYESKMSVEAKSLLELAKYRYQSITLNYHYRSMYEELINFSNYAFYNGKIEVVPNIDNDKDFSPIERIKVDGRWIDRKNQKEAEEVVSLVKEVFKTRQNDETIGIITFNITQKECIEELLEREAMRDIEFGILYRAELERKEGNEYKGIFVKNIENVQGDERDIIIFSVGYAKNEEGRVVRNFGSLTMKYGENRLNVAISRAKNKVYLITSIEPEELGYVDNLSRGAILLKKYLQYVKAVSNKDKEETQKILYSLDTIEKTNSEIIHFDSPFEEQVYERLVKAGFKVHTQVGSASYRIDMAIYDEEKSEYILGIECDGATYHSSKSARERDLYRQRFLESRGWVIHRIWSRDWWKNKDREIDNIKVKVEELK